MNRVGIAGMLFLLGGCSDGPSVRDARSRADAAVPIESERAPVAKVPPREAPARVPVYLGGDESHDACGGASKVVGGNAGRKHAMVRSGPGSKYPVTDSLPLDFIVFDCDGVEQGGWRGVVYRQDSEVECGTGSPIAERQAYQGPCRSAGCLMMISNS